VAPETQIPFATARDNFYRAARYGLAAPLHWLDGRCAPASELLQRELLPLAREGLNRNEACRRATSRVTWK
jgi:gamma-glutamyl:cysteine ligase YbdK (ATP-grasp superfamily)